MTRDQRPLFELTLLEEPDGVRFALSGELDLSNAAALDNVRDHMRGPNGTLTLDLAGLRFCDSVGLTTLIQAREAATSAGWHFQVVNPSANIASVLDLTGLTEYLNVINARPTAD